MTAFRSDPAPAKVFSPAQLRNPKCRYVLAREFGPDDRTEIIKLRESIEARLSGHFEAKSTKKCLGSFDPTNPFPYLSPNIAVKAIFGTFSSKIFHKRTQSGISKGEIELGLKRPHLRLGFKT